jgi:S1-C subfamily serine protease
MPVMLGGDLIVAADGQDIANTQDLSAAINSHRAGDTMTLTIFRGQKKMEVKVVLSDATDGAKTGQQT